VYLNILYHELKYCFLFFISYYYQLGINSLEAQLTIVELDLRLYTLCYFVRISFQSSYSLRVRSRRRKFPNQGFTIPGGHAFVNYYVSAFQTVAQMSPSECPLSGQRRFLLTPRVDEGAGSSGRTISWFPRDVWSSICFGRCTPPVCCAMSGLIVAYDGMFTRFGMTRLLISMPTGNT